MRALKRVVVTGMGALTPLGNDLQSTWNGLKTGQSGAAPITRFDASKFKTQFACELKNFNAEDHIPRKELRKMDLFSAYAIIASREAVAHAGFDLETLNKDRVGVIYASANGGMQTFQEQVTEYVQGDGTPRFNPFFVPRILADISSGLISMEYGFRGPNFNTISACASSTTSLIDAYNYIRLGMADVILSGGSEAAITEVGVGGFNALKALSTRNDDPATASRPFDANRDGFVMGEGACTIILEEYEHAIARGATIYAEVVGGGISGDAYHLTATHPEGKGAILGMEMAMKDAEISTRDVDYINMHATSTPLGDISELKAISQLFGSHLDTLNVSATKSMTGHMLGAAGAVESIASIMAVHEGIIPPTINTKETDEAVPAGINLTLGTAQEKNITYAMNNTFGFGGHNATVIFKKAE